MKLFNSSLCSHFILSYMFSFHTSGLNQVAQAVKNLPAMQADLGLIPGLGKSPGEGNGNPLQ